MVQFKIGSTITADRKRYRVTNIRMQGSMVDFGTNTRISLERGGVYRSVIVPKANVTRADVVDALAAAEVRVQQRMDGTR